MWPWSFRIEFCCGHNRSGCLRWRNGIAFDDAIDKARRNTSGPWQDRRCLLMRPLLFRMSSTVAMTVPDACDGAMELHLMLPWTGPAQSMLLAFNVFRC